jgi:hypothetical protein
MLALVKEMRFSTDDNPPIMADNGNGQRITYVNAKPRNYLVTNALAALSNANIEASALKRELSRVRDGEEFNFAYRTTAARLIRAAQQRGVWGNKASSHTPAYPLFQLLENLMPSPEGDRNFAALDTYLRRPPGRGR